jgi:hypothetical protein
MSGKKRQKESRCAHARSQSVAVDVEPVRRRERRRVPGIAINARSMTANGGQRRGGKTPEQRRGTSIDPATVIVVVAVRRPADTNRSP